LYFEKPLHNSVSQANKKWDVMSWNSINELIGLALIDSDFCQELLDDPVAAAQKRGVELTSQEQDVLSKIHVDDIFEFSQIVLDKLAPGNP
jgi:hypothetical protein